MAANYCSKKFYDIGPRFIEQKLELICSFRCDKIPQCININLVALLCFLSWTFMFILRTATFTNGNGNDPNDPNVFTFKVYQFQASQNVVFLFQFIYLRNKLECFLPLVTSALAYCWQVRATPSGVLFRCSDTREDLNSFTQDCCINVSKIYKHTNILRKNVLNTLAYYKPLYQTR